MKNRITLFPFILLFLLLPSSSVVAQGVGLGINPVTKEIVIEPGKSVTFKVNGHNPGFGDSVFHWEIQDLWHKNGETISMKGGTIKSPEAGKYQASSFLRVVPRTKKIKKGETGSFLVKVTAPKNANGGYITRILFNLGGPPKVKPEPLKLKDPKNPQDYPILKQSAAVGAAVATTITIRIKGKEIFKLSDEEILIDTKSTPGIVNFTYKATNKSNTFIKPELSAVLFSKDGKVIDKKQFIKSEDPIIYPDMKFEFKNGFDRPIKTAGEYKILITVSHAGQFLNTKQKVFTVTK